MCGILFSTNGDFSLKKFENALNLQKWRGPDNFSVHAVSENIFMGHVRLAIVDTNFDANQPMLSNCGQYKIIFNGEIYNHINLRNKYELNCKKKSDTETLLEGFIKIGVNFIDELDGMFSFVIVHIKSGQWWAARDRFGIKPLYQYKNRNQVIISSEPISIRHLANTSLRPDAWSEWELFRRNLPGSTFFNEINEILPGSIIQSGSKIAQLTIPSTNINSDIHDEELFQLIQESVTSHQLSDVKNVALLSGGLDSSIIVALSNVQTVYSVGLNHNNEFSEATETAKKLNRNIKNIIVTDQELEEAWKYLITLKGEPINVPNEGLIYLACKNMDSSEKVVLTGEGADEIFFGYDRIYRWALSQKKLDLDLFLKMYCYSKNVKMTDLMSEYFFTISEKKQTIEFVEDFFVEFHLPGLLRRMDFASMAASKEARVPFVNKKLFEVMYKSEYSKKINSIHSKIQLRKVANKLKLYGPLMRKKIGFSSSKIDNNNRYQEYENFSKFNREVLGW